MKNIFRYFLLVVLALSLDAQGGTTIIDDIAISEVDAFYGVDGTAGGTDGRDGQWRGNCGRGIFLYEHNDKDPHNANVPAMINPDLLPDTARLKTNDIWTSRTGCWNPEERFTFMPPYYDFDRGEGLPWFNSSAPDRVKRNILFFEPTGNKNAAYIPNATPPPVSTYEEGPWDEPYATDSSQVSEWLVPNDRLLMPHPLCTNVVDESKEFYAPTGKKLGYKFLNELFEKQDAEDRVYKYGSIPRCVVEDYADDMDNYCQEYLEVSNSLLQKLPDINPIKSGVQNPIIDDYMEARYTSNRYFFDFDEYCWSSEPKPIAYAFDPYEHWMPLAIRAVEDPSGPDNDFGGASRKDIFGNEHFYTKTDIRRPTFTPYSARTVFDESFENSAGVTEHVMYSLEEYGYRDRPVMRRDYNYNPTNIYDPNNSPITPEELLVEDNMGRKQKMYKCLQMYIEQWAFEGDKGSIYLDQNEYAVRQGVGNDASMCQWVAYYDTSENYKEREYFKKIMLHFVDDGMDFKPVTDSPTKDIRDIRKYGCHESDDAGSGQKCDLVPNLVSIPVIDELNSQNTFGVTRKIGMRPEAFDYFNFLTFSALPTAGPKNPRAPYPGVVFSERFNLTHNVELSGGGVTVDPSNPSNAIKSLDDLYGTLIDVGTIGGAIGSLGINKINFAKRECKTAIPPQIWYDVVDLNSIVASNKCQFPKGARMINDLRLDCDSPFCDMIDGLSGNLLDPPTDERGREFKHWLTTLVDAPIISLVTPIPTLPVGMAGYQFENSTFPYFKFEWTAPDPVGGLFEVRDNTHRAAGEKVLPYPLEPIQPDMGKRNMFEDSSLGLVVVDEVFWGSSTFSPRARDWVNHSWPARSCMHSGSDVVDRLDLGIAQGKYKDILDDPDDEEGILLIHDSWKTFDDIRLDYLAGAEYDFSNYEFGMDDFESTYDDAISDPDDDNRKFGGFKVWLDKDYYYSWLPTKWSVGVGIYKAFWCEFELPYFPYVVGFDEFKHNKAPVISFYSINGKNGLFGKKELKKTARPRLEYYRVERIRDACGPFGARSTWIDYERNVGTTDDTKYKFFDWLIGDVSTRENDPDNYMIGALDDEGRQYYHLESRCAEWIDMYRKRVSNPRAISWRLARFDYEFMKSFLECTGPYQEDHPEVCQFNQDGWDFNQTESRCQTIYALANVAVLQAADAVCQALFGGIPIVGPGLVAACKEAARETIPPIECIAGFCAGHEFCEGRDIDEQITDNVLRAFDFATRGDATYWLDDDLHGPFGFKEDDPDVDESPGFETWKSNSIKINKSWLRGAYDDQDVAGDEPFGFWCGCTNDENGLFNQSEKAKTTRCREDYCTCEQHVMFVSRQLPNAMYLFAFAGYGAAKTLDPEPPKIDDVMIFQQGLIMLQSAMKPATICADYGPFRRWIQCFYQARASACPVLTRDVSDSIMYSSVKDPFLADKKVKDNIPENTQKKQSFNVCTGEDPIGHGNEDIEGFIRWSLEEPNHLARIPVWMESGGAAFGHEDLIFQSQVRDWESPFMEMAVPFPIDLVTRHCGKTPSGDPLWGKRVIDDEGASIEVEGCTGEEFELGNFAIGYVKAENTHGEYPNNLLEIQQREGVGYSQIVYFNPPPDGQDEPIWDEFEITDPRFRTSFLRTRDTNTIVPVVDTNCFMQDFPLDDPSAPKCDSKKYQQLYYKYTKGLYAVASAFAYTTYPEEPGDPTILDNDPDNNIDGTNEQNIHPRAQDKVVGPRGCDIGGWWEMMLYQARCIRWHKLNCICDYDKTFAKGNAVNYALRRAGAKFEVVGPTVLGAKYETQVEAEQDGIIYAVLDEAERTSSGAAKELNLGTGATQRRDNVVVGKYRLDPDTGRPVLITVIDGAAVDTTGEYKPGIAVSKTPRYFPLKDRGLVGPEFAPLNEEDVPADIWDDEDHKLVDLSNARVGDLVIWDEEITDPDTGLDVGYPRHIAYVEEVTLSGGIVTSINVAEMNWGKLYDSCGNTNKWGIESRRVIHRPSCSAGVTPSNCPYDLTVVPSPSAPDATGTIDKYADCRNADWYHCVEKYWDQVKIYRPYINENGVYGEATPDPAYTSSSCGAISDFPQPINEQRLSDLANDLLGSGGVHSPPAPNKLKTGGAFDPDKVRRYLQIAYSNGDISLEDMLYNTDLWKLLVKPGDYGKYYVDEVDEFLFNPLKGAADNCDPHPLIRDNYQDYIDFVRQLKGVV